MRNTDDKNKIDNLIYSKSDDILSWIPDNDGQIIDQGTSSDRSTFDELFKISNYYNVDNDIFENIYSEINDISNDNIREFIIKFISIFQTTLALYDNALTKLSDYLSPLIMNTLDDGSVLIEWIYSDFRIGFSIEPNTDESFWYLVANKKYNGLTVSNTLKLENTMNILNLLIEFTIRNV